MNQKKCLRERCDKMKITCKDIDMGNYTLKYYKCNKFTTNQINFIFETKLTKNK